MPIFVTVETGKKLHGGKMKFEERTSNAEGRRGAADRQDACPPLTAASEKQPGAGDKYWARRPVACVVEIRGEEVELRHLIGADSKRLMGLAMAALQGADLSALAGIDADSPETIGKGIQLLSSAPDLLNEVVGIASGRGVEWAETLTLLELSRVHKEYFRNVEVAETVGNFFAAWGSLV